MWSVIPIVLFSLVASASPVDHRKALTRRDACDGVDAMPILYHEYRSDKCKPKYKISDDGVCRQCNFQENSCVAFCQVRTNFFYGQEQPFPNTFCHGPQTCTITSTHTRTVGWSVNISPKVEAALKVGVSGSYTKSTADAVARSFSIKLDDKKCGYFTFVPVIKSTCGSLTSQKPAALPIPGTPPGAIYCTGDHDTKHNVCGDQLRLNSDGTVDGETIFVHTDCENRMPRPAKEQDAIYQKPGVPMDRGMQKAWANTWGKEDLTAADKDTPVKCETSGGSPKVEDCRLAFDSLMQFPELEARAGKKGKTWWAAYNHSCAIALYYGSDWEEKSCGITLGDIAVAAYTISDQCPKDGKLGGKRKFEKDGCKAQLQIMHTEGLPPSGV